jgi:hypothetical protein
MVMVVRLSVCLPLCDAVSTAKPLDIAVWNIYKNVCGNASSQPCSSIIKSNVPKAIDERNET